MIPAAAVAASSAAPMAIRAICQPGMPPTTTTWIPAPGGGSGGCLSQPGGRGGNGSASAAGATAANGQQGTGQPGQDSGQTADAVHDKFLRVMLDRLVRVWAGQRHGRYPTFYGCPNPCGQA